MQALEISGALTGLKVADIDDLDRYKAAVERGGQTGWGYFFPYLLSKNRPLRSATLLTEEGGSLCVFRWRVDDTGQRLDLHLPPIPMNVPALRHCLERANDFNGGFSARILRIDAADAPALSGLRYLKVRERRQQYLFVPGTYENLTGKSLYTIRRNVAQVERLPEVHVAPYSPGHADECMELLSRWKKGHREMHGTAGGTGATRCAIELAGRLPARDLSGEVVFIDGRLAAFAFGGEIRPGLACSFDRKCDSEVRGLSYFHFRSFLLRLRDFERVNDGSDARRTGLRQLKDSFRPVGMHTEFRAEQIGPP
jgi:hypothetical protein